MRVVASIFAVVAGVLVFACVSTTDDVVIAKRPDQQGFGTGEAGASSEQDSSASSAGLCPTNECPTGRATCPDSPYPCGVDLTSDDENCGTCGNACPVISGLHVRTSCIGGACQFGCENNFADCNGLVEDGCEVTLLADEDNCGACGITCPDVCWEGKCGCPNGQTFCGSFCADLKTNGENCGQCGHVCPPDTHPPLPTEWHAGYSPCNGGECNYLRACVSPWADCDHDLGDESGNGCETGTNSDPKNCGACGVACAPGEACVYGECVCQCGSSCYHVTTDIDNCGACHSVCPGSRDDSAHGAPVCDDGVCDYRCNVDWADCDGLVRNGCETNLRSDPLNCGGCGIRCTGTEGQACVDGRCTMKECGPK